MSETVSQAYQSQHCLQCGFQPYLYLLLLPADIGTPASSQLLRRLRAGAVGNTLSSVWELALMMWGMMSCPALCVW